MPYCRSWWRDVEINDALVIKGLQEDHLAQLAAELLRGQVHCSCELNTCLARLSHYFPLPLGYSRRPLHPPWSSIQTRQSTDGLLGSTFNMQLLTCSQHTNLFALHLYDATDLKGAVSQLR
jgi:hypothetical protein